MKTPKIMFTETPTGSITKLKTGKRIDVIRKFEHEENAEHIPPTKKEQSIAKAFESAGLSFQKALELVKEKLNLGSTPKELKETARNLKKLDKYSRITIPRT